MHFVSSYFSSIVAAIRYCKTCTNTKASNHTNTAEILIFNQDQFACIQLLHCVD